MITNQSTTSSKNKSKITVMILGAPETGKTSFVIRFCDNKFDSFYIPSFSQEITKKTTVLNYKRFNIEFIVDNFDNLTNIELNKPDCFFVFFDCMNRTSLKKAEELVKKLKKKSRIIFLVMNKIDLQSSGGYKLEENEKEYLKKLNVEYCEISVQSNAGISSMMQKLGTIFDYDE